MRDIGKKNNMTKLTRFLEHTKAKFKLTKLQAKRPLTLPSGSSAVGYLSIMNRDGRPFVLVSTESDYIRTSPIVRIVSFSKTSTTFETQGGIYRLKLLKGDKNAT